MDKIERAKDLLRYYFREALGSLDSDEGAEIDTIVDLIADGVQERLMVKLKELTRFGSQL